MPLDVIGAGFGRTGTQTLKLALERLGFDPCHHMTEVLDNPGQLDFWNRAAAGEPVDWEEVYGNYRATVDWPGCHFYAELAERYPRAKVLLSLRDPEEWYASMDQTILVGMRQMRLDQPVPRDHPMYFGAVIVGQQDLGGDLSKDEVIAAFERHNEAVRRTIPADRLLEFRSSDGWEPLCAFLGVPVPGEPFPRTNARENFAAHIDKARSVAEQAGAQAGG